MVLVLYFKTGEHVIFYGLYLDDQVYELVLINNKNIFYGTWYKEYTRIHKI